MQATSYTVVAKRGKDSDSGDSWYGAGRSQAHARSRAQTGQWFKSAVQGDFNYYAVPERTSRVWGASAFLAPMANGTPPEHKHPVGIKHLVSLPGSSNALLSSRQRARLRALAACKDLLTLWKDADPDIPILKKAKAEYAKLR